jgi:hypothetical protein
MIEAALDKVMVYYVTLLALYAAGERNGVCRCRDQ